MHWFLNACPSRGGILLWHLIAVYRIYCQLNKGNCMTIPCPQTARQCNEPISGYYWYPKSPQNYLLQWGIHCIPKLGEACGSGSVQQSSVRRSSISRVAWGQVISGTRFLEVCHHEKIEVNTYLQETRRISSIYLAHTCLATRLSCNYEVKKLFIQRAYEVLLIRLFILSPFRVKSISYFLEHHIEVQTMPKRWVQALYD
jgi:hypothetical protein